MKITMIENQNLRKKATTAPPFGTEFTNYMFTMKYTEEKGWHDAVIKPYGDFEISPAALCLHYGQTIFEGLKVLKYNDKRILFRPDANYVRFNASARRMCMPEIDVDFALKATIELIKVEKDEWFYDVPNSSIYIRPFMIATDAKIGAHEGLEYLFMIILSPMVAYFSSSEVNLVTETNYMRVASNGTGEAKNGGNYGGAFYATQIAKKKGYTQVLWLDPQEQKYIEEAGMMNVFFVVDDKIITPKTTGSILKGITRNSVIKLAPDLGYEIDEQKIDINDIVKWYQEGRISEIFASGTAASIQPFDSLTHNDFKMSFIYDENSKCNKIFQYLEDLKHGKIADEYNFIQTF